MVHRLCAAFTILACMTNAATADLIDFEDAAAYGGDNAQASSYLAYYGVSISAEAGWFGDNSTADIQFEKTGFDGTDSFLSWAAPAGIDGGAYWGSSPALAQLGDYVLKIGAGHMPYFNADHFKLSIGYDAAVSSASAQIWDIDGSEQFSVVGYDANGNQVASVDSPTGGNDGDGWTWSLNAAEGFSISTIEINLIGGGNLQGIAFDNFNSTASTHTVPIPAAFPVGLLGMIGLIVQRKRSNRRETQQNA